MTVSLEEKFIGSMLGLAVGDALGGHFEAQSPEWLASRFGNANELLRNPPEAPWMYTDDTQMAIGVSEALLKDAEIVEASLCEAFVENYLPSRGYGRGARIILQAMEEGQDYKHWANELFPGGSYGNGAAMRVAPVGLLFHDNLDRCWDQARQASLPTHVHPLGVEGAQLIATAVAICIRHERLDNERLEKARFIEELLSRCETEGFIGKLKYAATVETIDEVAQLGNGIAAQDSVVTAIACFLLWPDSYEQVVANAILLGGDTDTIAAMAGAIVGAHLGVNSVPSELLNCLEDGYKGRSYLQDLARQLCELFQASRS